MPRFRHAILTLSLCSSVACGRADQSSEPARKARAPLVEPARAKVPMFDLRPKEVYAEEDIGVSKPALEKALGNFNMTYYWVAAQKRKGNEPIVDKKCKRIARVSKSFKRRLSLEGSGILKDGRTISTAGGCKCDGPCYFMPEETHKWGAGVAQRPLAPFRSIAVDPREIKIGTSLYVAELDGLTMPGAGAEGGFVHDGCVVADDRGGGVRGKQIDFFAGRRDHYENFFSRHKIKTVQVYPGGERCRAHADEHDSLRTANAGSS